MQKDERNTNAIETERLRKIDPVYRHNVSDEPIDIIRVNECEGSDLYSLTSKRFRRLYNEYDKSQKLLSEAVDLLEKLRLMNHEYIFDEDYQEYIHSDTFNRLNKFMVKVGEYEFEELFWTQERIEEARKKAEEWAKHLNWNWDND